MNVAASAADDVVVHEKNNKYLDECMRTLDDNEGATSPFNNYHNSSSSSVHSKHVTASLAASDDGLHSISKNNASSFVSLRDIQNDKILIHHDSDEMDDSLTTTSSSFHSLNILFQGNERSLLLFDAIEEDITSSNNHQDEIENHHQQNKIKPNQTSRYQIISQQQQQITSEKSTRNWTPSWMPSSLLWCCGEKAIE